jgi:hypothetical protein
MIGVTIGASVFAEFAANDVRPHADDEGHFSGRYCGHLARMDYERLLAGGAFHLNNSIPCAGAF